MTTSQNREGMFLIFCRREQEGEKVERNANNCEWERVILFLLLTNRGFISGKPLKNKDIDTGVVDQDKESGGDEKHRHALSQTQGA